MNVIYAVSDASSGDKLKAFIETYTRWQIKAGTTDLLTAVRQVNQYKPDVLFLQTRFKNGSAFDVIKHLDKPYPQVIFITAIDKYAIGTFKKLKQHFLLMPLQKKKCIKIFKGLNKESVDQNRLQGNLNALIKAFKPKFKYAKRLMMLKSNGSHFIDVTDIVYVQEENAILSYTNAYKSYQQPGRLKLLRKQLNPSQFILISEVCLVNVDQIKRIKVLLSRGCLLTMKNGQQFKLSSKYWKQISQ